MDLPQRSSHTEMPDGGLITHQRLDNLYLQVNNGDLRLQLSTADVTAFSPTEAELTAAFGSPAAVGAGFIRLVDDAGAGTTLHIVASDGVSWYYFGLTKAS